METQTNLPNILIVDDEIGPRESLRMILKRNYSVYTAESGYAALEMVQHLPMDVVTLDLKMQGISGVETLKEIRAIDPDAMIIVITGYGTLNSAIEAIRHGVFDYIPKPFNVPEILSIIERAVQRRQLNVKLKGYLDHSFQASQAKRASPGLSFPLEDETQWKPASRWDDGSVSDHQNCLEFAKVLAYTLEEKDPYTSGHSERVCYYSDLIAKQLGLPVKERNELQIAAYLHDIGKIGISNRFINKKGALTATDWAIIKQHSRKSIELLTPLRLSPDILSCIQHHHEHYDGTGYPQGLAGGDIPLGARIIAISDSYDSMTSNRPYRKPLTNDEARNELMACSGKQFDPHLINHFMAILKEMEDVFAVKDRSQALSATY